MSFSYVGQRFSALRITGEMVTAIRPPMAAVTNCGQEKDADMVAAAASGSCREGMATFVTSRNSTANLHTAAAATA